MLVLTVACPDLWLHNREAYARARAADVVRGSFGASWPANGGLRYLRCLVNGIRLEELRFF